MFSFSFKVSHDQSGTEYAVNLSDLPIVSPLLSSIFEHLHHLKISNIPDPELPAIFYAQKVGYTGYPPIPLPPAPATSPAVILPPSAVIHPLTAVAPLSFPTSADVQTVASPVLPSPPMKTSLKCKKKPGKVICMVCEEPQSKSNLARHMRVQHAEDPKKYKCGGPCKHQAPRWDMIIAHRNGGNCGRWDSESFSFSVNAL